jgi:uncharacterized protein YjbI with pentapeptide repeats
MSPNNPAPSVAARKIGGADFRRKPCVRREIVRTMTAEANVQILKKGVEEWNAWRSSNSSIRPDLSGADLGAANLGNANLCGVDLSGANLSGADLGGANMWHANMWRANLSGVNLSPANLSFAKLSGVAKRRPTNLSGANLAHANLSNANLRYANLIGANLSDANLSVTDLSGANLWRTDLSGTNLFAANLTDASLRNANLIGGNLTDANLTKARLAETVFGNVDLTRVIGLETCIHDGPSIIDHRTLERSGQLPLSLLRRVGLPDSLIEYLLAVRGKCPEGPEAAGSISEFGVNRSHCGNNANVR